MLIVPRRVFIKSAALFGVSSYLGKSHISTAFERVESAQAHKGNVPSHTGAILPVVVGNNFQRVVEVAGNVLQKGGTALDAIEQGINVIESDPTTPSVGVGGMPNAEGVVELDAAMMHGPTQKCGAVAALQGIEHPISVARKVMEQTEHVLLVGQGAQDFALRMGFEKKELLTEETKTRWRRWKEWRERGGGLTGQRPKPHDTVGLIVLDGNGDLSCGVSTSGTPFKLPGRVGDSAIIGAGSYVDNDIGGAVATGTGEHVIRFGGSFAIVENMRHGMTPEEACREVLGRMFSKIQRPDVMFTALKKDGQYASVGTRDYTSFVFSGGHTVAVEAVVVRSEN